MPKGQRVGLHVSAAGGVSNAPENAKAFGAECFQFFSRSPRGGGAAPITDEQATLFRERCEEYGLESYIHTPYYINFASKNTKIYHGSINAVRQELERGSQLGVKYVMTHMGSARDHVAEGSVDVPKSAITQAIKGLKEIYKGKPKFSTELLLEISAGAGAVLG
ncbi:MAG: TIM barrel protein, partial [Candidatus Andersenbacteria bacterium]